MTYPRRSECIKRFLSAYTHKDLAALYHRGMECQLNVAQDGGERVSGEYLGRQWHKWQDNNTGETWSSFRIPRNAMSEPEDNDSEIRWDIERHVEGIGMTGWNWIDKRSYWVAFDFDEITGHSDRHGQKMSPEQLLEVQRAASEIPWVTIRKSTSGKGLHLYVFMEPVPTNNHTEHAAIARAIIGKMSAMTGFDFSARVDVCGHNMWVWHRKMKGTDGLTLIKQGTLLEEPPLNWTDHISVVRGKRKKTLPKQVENSGENATELSEADRIFNELTGQSARIPLDEGHRRLIKWLEENKAVVWWDSDHHMLVTHTYHLQEAHTALGMKGVFKTNATGTEYGHDHNCFSGDTEVLTDKGVFRIRDLAEIGKATLYVKTNSGMQWIQSEIRSFGIQKTYPVFFGNQSYVRATRHHLWLQRNKAQRIPTCNLTTKIELPLAPQTLPEVDWEGYTTATVDLSNEIEEEVFCAVVPYHYNFTLGNSVITGNCFAFPLRRSAWAVRRFTMGVQEHPSWTQDGAGWTRCFLNHEPDLSTASRSFGGVEHTAGGFVFREAGVAIEAARLMGVKMALPDWLLRRRARLKMHKDGQRVVAEVEHDSDDSPRNGEMDGWLSEKGQWKRIFNAPISALPESEVGNYDDLVRHLVTENGGDYGWVIKRDGQWGEESYSNIKIAMKAAGISNVKEMELILGASVMKPWKVVNRPFQPMFPGDREWNRDAAQFRFIPTTTKDNKNYPTWMKILKHIGSSLDHAIGENGWAQANGIKTGADYLKVWLSSLFQYPLEPLPYLFLWGPQDSGKSIFHEGVSQLLTRGYVRADSALTNPSGFNAELRYAIMCVIEETDLKKNKLAYSRIKDWVTARQLPVHEKGKTPIGLPNTTHWVQCSNHKDHCPIFPGDTRITMIHVPAIPIEEMIPKSLLLKELEKEGPDFLGELMQLELPAPASRLNVEVIRTQDKIDLEQANRTALEEFIDEHVHYVTGKMITLGEFFTRFQESLDGSELPYWTKQKVSTQMDSRFPKGRRPKDGQWAFGNMSWEAHKPEDEVLPRLISVGQQLRYAQ